LITAIAGGRVEPYALGGLGLIAASQDDDALAAEHACDLIAGHYWELIGAVARYLFDCSVLLT
jgi:hypothetical protein